MAHSLPVLRDPDSAAALLHGALPPAEDPTSRRRWWPKIVAVVTTLFVAYHGLALLSWNLPHKHAGKDFYRQLSKMMQTARYFRGTGNVQSWSMFAPNPNRTNAFVRVLVIDERDEVWDMDHDIYKKNRYPYLWYDRMGKVNRRIDGKKGYQAAYGAYICREWEREHGVLPKEVRFVRRSTRIPTPWDASVRHGPLGLRYEPWDLPMRQSEQERIRCAKAKHGQLSPELRARHGMEPAPKGHFRDVNISTWWDRQERARKREEREASRRKSSLPRFGERQGSAAPVRDSEGGASMDDDATRLDRAGGLDEVLMDTPAVNDTGTGSSPAAFEPVSGASLSN